MLQLSHGAASFMSYIRKDNTTSIGVPTVHHEGLSHYSPDVAANDDKFG